jgi:hypothetical protein
VATGTDEQIGLTAKECRDLQHIDDRRDLGRMM